MEQLILIGAIVLLSILDAVARGKKGRGQSLPPAEEWEWEEEPEGSSLPIDIDPDRDGIPGAPRQEYTEPYRPQDAGSQREPGGTASPRRPEGAGSPRGSEGMVPKDLWEEILVLAEGREPGRSRPEPPPPDPKRAPVAKPARRSVEPVHAVHLTHPEYGTDPSERRGSGVAARVERVPLSADIAAARAMLRSGRSGLLRQAVILDEVLGPPLALREHDAEERG